MTFGSRSVQELLAIIFACQCFSTYLLGRSFVAESNHKPLAMIAIGNDSHEEPCQCVTMSSEDAAGATEIQCHHQVPPREPNGTSGSTEPLPELLPVCDVLILKGPLFALKSDFLSIEATCLLTLGALLPHSTFTKPNQYDAAWLISILGMSVFIT